MKSTIEINKPIYDPLNDRYITPIASGTNLDHFICIIEEMPEFDDEAVEMKYIDYEIVGRQMFTRKELESILRRGYSYNIERW